MRMLLLYALQWIAETTQIMPPNKIQDSGVGLAMRGVAASIDVICGYKCAQKIWF